MARAGWPAAVFVVGTLALMLLGAEQTTASYTPQVSGNVKEYNFTVSLENTTLVITISSAMQPFIAC